MIFAKIVVKTDMSEFIIFYQRDEFQENRIFTEFCISAKLEKGSFFSMFRIRIRKQDSAELFMINNGCT
jgi:hypothetical protein